MGTITGGRAFLYQPRIHVVDVGGNIRVAESSLRVHVSLYNNPSDSALTPAHWTFVPVINGEAQFKQLISAKVGRYVEICFVAEYFYYFY